MVAIVQNKLNDPPAPYLSHLPDKTFIRSGGCDYRIDGDSVVRVSADDGPVEFFSLKLFSFRYAFPEEAIAEVPTLRGMFYVKTGVASLLAPPPIAERIDLAKRVWGHSEYMVVERKRCQYPVRGRLLTNGRMFRILFNVPLSVVKTDDFFGAEEPLAFYYAADGTAEEVRIIIDLPVHASSESQLAFLTPANAAFTKNDLARKIALEVEKSLSNPGMVVVAYDFGELRKEVRFEDMSLAELVQRSTGDFWATIAVRVGDARL